MSSVIDDALFDQVDVFQLGSVRDVLALEIRIKCCNDEVSLYLIVRSRYPNRDILTFALAFVVKFMAFHLMRISEGAL